jgi:soluble lytic murein transglycosylase
MPRSKSKGPSGPSVIKKKILSAMNDFDSDRQLEWGKSLFDMQLYGDAAQLLKRAAEQSAGSAKASKPYFMAGRAFQLSNDYSRAKDMYQIVLKNYPASVEVVDAAIQWGLVNVNENDPSEAITHLEVARAHHLTSQQDLISLFWLYQSYKVKRTEAGIANSAAELIKRFGLTYYGIIAYQDSNRALPQYPKVKEKPAKIYLSEQETEAIARAKLLLKAGLFNAASDELSIFSNRPLSQDEQAYLLNFYSQAIHHQKSFALLSGMFDDSPDKKTDSLVRRLFPKEFWDLANNDKMRADLDPFLILSVMKQESGFDYRAVSHSGALGLLQMIPPTAQEVKLELKSDADMPSSLTDPATNVKYCAYYLAKLIKKYNGSIPLALAAYNAGPTRITQFINAKGGVVRDTWVDELPWAETSFYVKSILKNYLMYRILYGGLTQLPVPPWASPLPAPSASPTASPTSR